MNNWPGNTYLILTSGDIADSLDRAAASVFTSFHFSRPRLRDSMSSSHSDSLVKSSDSPVLKSSDSMLRSDSLLRKQVPKGPTVQYVYPGRHYLHHLQEALEAFLMPPKGSQVLPQVYLGHIHGHRGHLGIKKHF